MTLIDLRTFENKSGTSYDATATTKIYAEDLNRFKNALQEAGSSLYLSGGSVIGSLSLADINETKIVDGTTYAKTDVGIQAAIDSLPATGGEVYIPAGTYNISAELSLPNKVTIKGAGFSTILQAPNGASQGRFFDIEGDDITIRDLTIDANATNTTLQNSIHCADAHTNIVIKNLKILNSGLNGMDFDNVTGLRVMNNIIKTFGIINNGEGILARSTCSDVIIRGNDVSDAQRGFSNCISLGGPGLIANNYCHDTLASGINVEGGNDANVIGNYCENCTLNGIYLPNVSVIDNMNVTGNLCRNNTEHGIALTGEFNNVNLSNNLCHTNGGTGIIVSQDGETSSNININGNNIANNTGHGIVVADSGTGTLDTMSIAGNTVTGNDKGIVVTYDEGTNIAITGNTCTNNDSVGIESTGERVSITGNTVNGSTDAWTSGISLAGAGAYSTISGNTVSDCAFCGIEINSSYFICVGNICFDNGQVSASNAGIKVQNNVTNGVITGNSCFDAQGTKTQIYGIQISSTGTDKLIVTNNMLSANLTGAISGNAGTNGVLNNNITE